MLEKFKKRMKSEKGFTLVELLAVIVILGIILAIAIPSIGNIVSKSENKAHEANVQLIENGAKLAAISDDKTEAEYTLKQLVDGGFLEEIPKSLGNTEYKDTDKIVVEKSKARYTSFRDDKSDEIKR